METQWRAASSATRSTEVPCAPRATLPTNRGDMPRWFDCCKATAKTPAELSNLGIALNAVGRTCRGRGRIPQGRSRSIRLRPGSLQPRQSLARAGAQRRGDRRAFDGPSRFVLIMRTPGITSADRCKRRPTEGGTGSLPSCGRIRAGQRDHACQSGNTAVRAQPQCRGVRGTASSAPARSQLLDRPRQSWRIAWPVGLSDRRGDSLPQWLALDPTNHRWLINLGVALLSQGRHAESEACYRQALALQPDHASGHGNLLFALGYRTDVTPEAIFAEYQDWNRRYAAASRVATNASSHTDTTPNRRLRVGYVSADFRKHAVALFAEPLLAAHDHAKRRTVPLLGRCCRGCHHRTLPCPLRPLAQHARPQ